MPLSMAAATLASGALAAGAGAAQAGFGGKMNKRASREAQKQRDWQTSEREASQKFQTDWRDTIMEYESPSSQMARLKSAGLNPDLMYGNGSVLSGTSGTAPSASSGSGAMADSPGSSGVYEGIANIGKSAQDALMQSSQRSLNKSQEKLNTQKVDESSKSVELMDSTISLNHIRGDLTESQISEIAANIRNSDQAVSESKQRIQNMIKEAELISSRKDLTNAQKDKVLADTALSKQEFDQMDKLFDIEFNRAKISLRQDIIDIGFSEAEFSHLDDFMKDLGRYWRMTLQSGENEESKLAFESKWFKEWSGNVEYRDSKNNKQYYPVKNNLEALMAMTYFEMFQQHDQFNQQYKLYKRYSEANAVSNIVSGMIQSAVSVYSAKSGRIGAKNIGRRMTGRAGRNSHGTYEEYYNYD